MNPRFVWPAVVLAGIGLVVAGAMAIAGVPIETITLVSSIMVTPVLAAFVAGQIADVKSTTSQVAQQTNGTLTRLVDIIERQGQMLHTATASVQNGQPDPPDQAAA